MPFASIEEAAADLREGRMIIIVDDEDRENEGDLVCAAERRRAFPVCSRAPPVFTGRQTPAFRVT